MEVENYDIVRMIEHGKLCYVSADCVEGRQLIYWLKYHPHMSKHDLFAWMEELIRQIGQFHRLRGAPCYKYVNPYSIIVTQEKKLCLLDSGADSNQALIRQMQRRSIRENFLPPEEQLYPKESISLDIYGLGRTLQYLLCVTEIEPLLSKKEEHKLKRIISRCLNRHSKKSFQQISEIQKHLPISKMKQKKAALKFRKIFLAVILIAAVIGFYFIGQPMKEQPIKEKPKEQIKSEGNSKQSPPKSSEEINLIFDMGLLYLLEKEDYENGKAYFQSIKKEHKAAAAYLTIAEWLAGKITEDDIRLEKSLIQAEENLPVKNVQNCYRILLRAYALRDRPEAAKRIIRIGTACLALGEEEEVLEEITQKELSEFMAAAYEELGEYESAAELYEKQLFMESKDDVREELYQKLTMLWENADKLDKAGEICLKGIKEYSRSARLRTARIRLLCKDAGIGREVCAQTIQEYLKEVPEIKESEEFQKLQNEYEITMEGEQVWVGR